MSSSPRTFCSLALIVLASLASCGPASSPSPDAAPPQAVPTSPAGGFAVTSMFDIELPPAARPVLATLTAATDGPDDPTRYLVDRMIATLPDGQVKLVAVQAAPYVAAYLNERLVDIAPRLVTGLGAIADGLSRIARHFGTTETLQIDSSGAAIRTLTGARFELGATTTTVRFADSGLADIVTGAHVFLDTEGRVTIGAHAHALPYGAVLRLGLERAVIASVEPGAPDLATALGALVDCTKLGDLAASSIGLGPASLYHTACRAAMTAIASELYAQLAAIDATPLALELTGAADGIDHDGDGSLDELRAGRWSGSLQAAGTHVPVAAASFAGTKAP